MNLFTILTCLYFFKKYIRNTEIVDGNDERVLILNYEIENDKVTLDQIIKIQENREMLNLLESNDTKTEDKLYEIEGRGLPSIFSLLKGGLLSDWNFDFDFDPNALNLDGL
jgi:chaperonin GroEL (HSP60 family)